MNCFRSLYLWVDLQQEADTGVTPRGCELLSFFVPLGWFTASYPQTAPAWRLWIAFVLCTFGLIYSYPLFKRFRIVLWIAFVLCTFGLIYSKAWSTVRISRLWIAFVLCTFGLIYSRTGIATIIRTVVNCFRSLYLWVDLQLRLLLSRTKPRCELLSFFVPLGWFTAAAAFRFLSSLLWIAFVLCTFGLIYSWGETVRKVADWYILGKYK